MVLRKILGRPIDEELAHHERLSKKSALGVYGLDALSSVAYGPDEILYVLLLAGAAGIAFSIPVACAIVALLVIVVVSYRQTIMAYPNGGGSYTVARENLGLPAGLTAAAALMFGYLATIAVSTTAGVAAIVAFIPQLESHRVAASVVAIVFLMIINLRGVRESGGAVIVPTFIFLGSMGILLAWGIGKAIWGGGLPHLHQAPAALDGLSLFLVLRAFSGGCTAMTGVEAVANGVPQFKTPEAKNASSTLLVLAALLAVLFLGVTILGVAIGAQPSDQANVIAQVGKAVAGASSPLFYVVQISAAFILLFAANTPFNGFPQLAAVIAKDGYFPQQFSRRGLRLTYTNGIVAIGLVAIILVIAFGGSTHALIPLYGVGVFLCFTLSQAGMVRHWTRTRSQGWRWKLWINGFGALVTGVVTLIVLATKFTSGAWIVFLLIPILVLNFIGISRHYLFIRERLQVADKPRIDNHRKWPIVILAVRIDKALKEAIEYAASLSDDVTVIHVANDRDAAKALIKEWKQWAPEIPLHIVRSPYREVLRPLLNDLEKIRARYPEQRLTVILPEIVPQHWWEQPLRTQLSLSIKYALLRRPGFIVTSVPVQVDR